MLDLLYPDLSVGENGHLYFASFDTVALAREFGTPAMFIDEDRVRAHCREYVCAMKKYLPAGSMPMFASKALSFKEIYRVVGSEGMGTDIVSPGELYTAAAAGFDLKNAVFHGNNKTDADIVYAVNSGIGYFAADNAEELYAVNSAAARAGVRQKILLRVTPGIDPHTHKKISTGGVDSKFGAAISTGDAEKLASLALSLGNIELCGFHCHIGSQIFEVTPFIDAVDIMTSFIARVKQEFGYSAHILNLGGGFGVRYVKDDPSVSVTDNIRQIASALYDDCRDKGIDPPEVMLEPGRSIVADAGITLYTVGSVKEIPGVKNYVSVDGGMTDNPRYTLYQSAYTVVNASAAADRADLECTLCGRCCESGDILQEKVLIPRPSRGDIIAVLTTGAYNYSMASNYNRIPRPPVVMLSGSNARVAVRRETYEDLVRCDL